MTGEIPIDSVDNGIADYYKRKDSEAESIRREFELAVTRGATLDELREIKSRLEFAEYVGD